MKSVEARSPDERGEIRELRWLGASRSEIPHVASLMRATLPMGHGPVGRGNLRRKASPGALSDISMSAPCKWATAATRLRPRPFPGVRRLRSSR
jgi:hypothetical protein